MFVKTNSVDNILDLSAMEENVYILKALRDGLDASSQKSHDAAMYGRDLLPPQKPEPVKCKIKSVPERPKTDKNSQTLRQSRYLLTGALVLGCTALLLFIVLLFRVDFFQKPFSESGALGKSFLIVCAFAVIVLFASFILKTVEMARFREEMKSWEAVRLQINEQNEQEIVRCQNEESLQLAEYNAKLEEYERIKRVYILRESVKARIYGLLKSKIHVLAVAAEKQLSELHSVLNIVPAEYRRFDSMQKIKEYLQDGIASSPEKAILQYTEDVISEKVPKFASDFSDKKTAYPEMKDIYDSITRITSEVNESVNALQSFIDPIIEKAVSFEERSVNDTVLAIEFAKNFEYSSVAVFAKEAADGNFAIYSKYITK